MKVTGGMLAEVTTVEVVVGVAELAGAVVTGGMKPGAEARPKGGRRRELTMVEGPAGGGTPGMEVRGM